MRYLTSLFLLMFVFASLCLVSVPKIVSAHENGSSHSHPHPPEQNCMTCGLPGVPGQHVCLVDERREQEQDVKISNLNAELKRFEDKYDDDKNNNGIIDALIGALLIVIVAIGILRCVRIHPKNRLRFTRR